MKINKPEEGENGPGDTNKNICNDVLKMSGNDVTDNIDLSRENILCRKKKGPHIGVVGRGSSSTCSFSQSTNSEICFEIKHEKPVHAGISKHRKHSLMQAMRRSLSEVG